MHDTGFPGGKYRSNNGTIKAPFGRSLRHGERCFVAERRLPLAGRSTMPVWHDEPTLDAGPAVWELDFPETTAPRRFHHEHISRLHLDARDMT